jgi:hypothetical protein
VPQLAVAIQPILQRDAPLYAMFDDYWKYDWVLPVFRYRDLPHLQKAFWTKVVKPAESKAEELAGRRASALRFPRRRSKR